MMNEISIENLTNYDIDLEFLNDVIKYTLKTEKVVSSERWKLETEYYYCR